MPDCLAVAYTPELADPMLQDIMGGSFSIAFPAEDIRVVLHPGANKVDRKLWERCKTVPAVAEKLAMRLFEEIELGEDMKEVKDDEPGIPIAKVELKAAMRLVNHCRHIPQLEAWHDTETRMQVRSAIKRRITQLQEGSEV